MVKSLLKKVAGKLRRQSPPPAAPPQPEPAPVSAGEDFPTRFARIFFGVFTLIILYFSYLIIKPYLVEIFLALVLFFQTKPLYNLVLRLCRWRALAAALTCLLLALIIILPIVMLTSIIASQALDLYNLISSGLQSGALWQFLTRELAFIEKYLQDLGLPLNPENLQLEQLIRQTLITASQFVYNNAISLVRGFTSFFLSLLLVLFVTFFCFLEGDRFIAELKKLSPLDPRHNDEILGDVEATIRATIRGTVLVAIIQGILGGIGFAIFGVPRAAFWGTITILASVLPVVGPAVIWLPAALYLFFQGHKMLALGMLFWGAVVIGAIDNILKPILMRGGRQTPSIFTLFAIMGGLSYFGMVGFILGPLILSFLLSVLAIYQKTILRPEIGAVEHTPEKGAPPPG